MGWVPTVFSRHDGGKPTMLLYLTAVKFCLRGVSQETRMIS